MPVELDPKVIAAAVAGAIDAAGYARGVQAVAMIVAAQRASEQEDGEFASGARYALDEIAAAILQLKDGGK